jgi:hypothetical protein
MKLSPESVMIAEAKPTEVSTSSGPARFGMT